jgi:hypothetical protein
VSILEILYYTAYFKETLSQAIGFSPTLASDLCQVTLDHGRLSEADAVLFHVPNVVSLPRKKPGQIWIAMSLESDANYPLQCDPVFLRNFDMRMSFHRDADVRLLYFDVQYHLPVLQTPPKPKHRPAPAVYFASNNFALNNRFELVAQLMKLMKIDSYGRSQNNCKIRDDTGRMTKLDVISGYKFYLAFENSNCLDYVSEKMFDGLIAGSVPVYLGAPNVDEFLPSRKCIIKASDFATPAELAQYLLALGKNKQKYESYLAWKKEPLQESFTRLIQPEYDPPLRRLCAKISEFTAARHSKSSGARL